jgi:hypothetical protein
MFMEKIASVRTLAVLTCSLSLVSLAIHHHINDIIVTGTQLQQDTPAIRKYVLDRINNDLKKAKRFGKGLAKTFAGISYYAFDAIPFEFFTDPQAINVAFRRLDEGATYIQETKEAFKKSFMGSKRKLNHSHLAEFLYNQIVDRITVTDEQRVLLRKDPLKMDEFVRRGIVKRDEYMYYTLLNFVVRYYLEHEKK